MNLKGGSSTTSSKQQKTAKALDFEDMGKENVRSLTNNNVL